MTATRAYLDYNATHPLRAEARTAMIEALGEVGNPSSVHTEGRRARTIVEAARREVAGLLDVDPADVVFTSGATEANAWVMAGGWQEILLSPLEHDSVLKSARTSKARLGTLDVTARGAMDLSSLQAALERSTAAGRRLVCVVAANSETGVVQPVAEVAAMARQSGFQVFSDAVQLVGRAPLSALAGADFLSVSAHKIGGPKGVGALVLRGGADLPVLIAGGGQERGRRSGTENVAGIAGFGAAARAARLERDRFESVSVLRDRLLTGLRAATPAIEVLGDGAPRLVNTLCVAMRGLAADAVVIQMDLAGVAISAGSACSSGKVGASATLAAMGVATETARGAVRFSLGLATTADDVDAAIAAWRGIAERSRVAA